MSQDRGSQHDQGGGAGFDAAGLTPLMREIFQQCVADARTHADPDTDFEAFVELLWEEVAAAFGLVRREWPEGTVKPWPALLEEQRAYAEDVLDGRTTPGELPT